MAFALARLNFKGKDLIFTILLATMMIPGEMMVISLRYSRFGWVDAQGVGSYLAMIIYFAFLIKCLLALIPEFWFFCSGNSFSNKCSLALLVLRF